MATRILSTRLNIDIVYDYATNQLSGFRSFQINLLPAYDGTLPYKIKLFNDQLQLIEIGDFDYSVEPSIVFNYDNGSYQDFIEVTYGDVSLIIAINLLVINKGGSGGGTIDPPENPESFTYGLKYLSETKNIVNKVVRTEIWKRDFVGEITPMKCSVKHKYQNKKDLFESIVSSSLSMDFEADINMTFADLYSEDELTHKVILKYDGNVIFQGFIKPDGIDEDWVYNRWMLNVDAYDGLSTLKSLSFVTLNGGFFDTKRPMTIIEVVKACLDRTGLFLPINVNIGISYEDFATPITNDILEKLKVTTERYYQENGKIMDCEAVLNSLLQLFNATLIQVHGEWWIYRSVDLADSLEFRKYEGGNFVNNVTMPLGVIIGSHINGAEIFHCGENQRKSIAASVQAYRIKYEYGNAKSLAINSDLKMGAGLNCEGWTINGSNSNVKRRDYGVVITDSITNYKLIELNQNIDVFENDIIDIIIDMHSVIFSSLISSTMTIFITTDNFMLSQSSGGWIPKTSTLPVSATLNWRNNGGGLVWTVSMPKMPENGKLNFYIYLNSVYSDPNSGEYYYFKLNRIDIKPSNANIKGVSYTAQRNTRISTVTKADKTVYNGDSLSDLFVGTLYKSDGDTPTEKWHRKGVDEARELLEINVIDNLRISPRPMILFEGSVFGYFPALSLIEIQGVTGKFHALDYQFDLTKNEIKLKSKEFENAHLPNNAFRQNPDVTGGIVDKETDSGAETKVTIV